SIRINGKKMRKFANYFLVAAGIGLWIYSGFFVAFALTLIGINNLFTPNWKGEKLANYLNVAITLFVALYYLTVEWLPLGTQASTTRDVGFVFLAIGAVLGMLWVLVIYYEQILRWALSSRWKFMAIPIITLVFGMLAWIGTERSFGFVAKGFETIGWKSFKETAFWQKSTETFPGIGEEFMPSLNE